MRWYLAVYVLALAARLAFLAVRGPTLTPDTSEYLAIADGLSAHWAFVLDGEPTIRRVPLYPVFLALLGGSPHINLIAAIQMALDASIAPMVLFAATMIAPRAWAILAALVYVIHPGAIYVSSTLLSESLFAWTVTLGVIVAAIGVVKDRPAVTAGGGLLFAAAILTRPTGLVLLVAIPAALYVVRRVPRRNVHALALVVGVLFLLPWTVRSSALAGQFVALQSGSAGTFFMASRWDFDQSDEAHLISQIAATECGRLILAAKLHATAADAVCRQAAIASIVANPVGYLESRARSFPYLFLHSFDEFTGINASFLGLLKSADYASFVIKALLLIVFSLVPLVLAAISLVKVRSHPLIAFSVAVWATTLVIHLPLFVQYRYWEPVGPELLISAAVGAGWISGLLPFKGNGNLRRTDPLQSLPADTSPQ